MTTLHFSYEGYTTETTTPDPNDEWDRASTSTEWCMPDHASLTKGYYGEHETIAAQVGVGQTVYLLTVIYSTGDSFGYDSGANCETIGLYISESLAIQARDIIEEDSKRPYNFNGVLCEVPLFDGSGMRPIQTNSWKGYFESMDSLQITALVITE